MRMFLNMTIWWKCRTVRYTRKMLVNLKTAYERSRLFPKSGVIPSEKNKQKLVEVLQVFILYQLPNQEF
jgi:hypothetical protein